MVEIISKELFAEVMGKEVYILGATKCKPNEIVYKNSEGTGSYINVYELAFEKSVDYAKRNGYELFIKFDEGGCSANISKDDISIYGTRSREDIRAVFEVCQYMLEEIERLNTHKES